MRTCLILGAVLAWAPCGSGLSAQDPGRRQAEDEARSRIAAYYAAIDQARIRVDYRSCEGVSIEDCFGGDPECVHPHHAQIGRAVLCTDPEFLTARGALLDRLDSLRVLAPDSDWIAGQVVYLAVKNGELARAEAMAMACRATPWWCQALRGFALHHVAPGSGGPHLDSALAAAPPDVRASGGSLLYLPAPRELSTLEGASVYRPGGDRGLRCEWTDLSPLLAWEPALLDRYASVPCGRNQEFEERFWWLADPLWSVEGNERRDEHIARNIHRRLRDEILLRDTLSEAGRAAWSHVQMIAFGPPNSWGTGQTYRCGGSNQPCESPSGAASSSSRRVTGFAPPHPYVAGGYSFAPDVFRFDRSIESTIDDWAVRWDSGAERMMTRETWHNVDQVQSAVLRRGPTLLVLTAAKLPVIVPSLATVSASLALGRPSDLHVDVTTAVVEPAGVVRAAREELVDDDWILSLELLGDDWRGRARHGAPPPTLLDGFGMSAPVLVDQRFEAGAVSLPRAMLPTTVLTGPEDVGTYFEIYGAERGEPLRFSVTVARRDAPSFLRRVAGALRLSSRPAVPVSLEWSGQAAGAEGAYMSQYLTLNLRALESGLYELTLRATRTNGVEATSSRFVRIERR